MRRSMPWALGLFAVALFLPGHGAGAAEPAIKTGDKLKVTIGPAALQIEDKTLTTLAAGTELTAEKVQGNWVKVTVTKDGEELTGWVHTRHLKVVKAEAPPAETTRPTPLPKEPPRPAVAKPADDGGFDKQGFKAANDNALAPGAMQHVLKVLGHNDTVEHRIAAIGFLMGCSRFFIRDDDEGHFNKNANPAAFAAAVSNITAEKVQKVTRLCTGTEAAAKPGAVFVILSSCGTYIRQPGKFNGVAFNKAFDNVDAAKVDKAAELTGSSREFALTLLLRLAGKLVDDAGTFDAPAFNSRLEAMKPADFTGNTDQRVALFRKQMTAGQ